MGDPFALVKGKLHVIVFSFLKHQATCRLAFSFFSSFLLICRERHASGWLVPSLIIMAARRDLRSIWGAVMNITGPLSSWSFAQETLPGMHHFRC